MPDTPTDSHDMEPPEWLRYAGPAQALAHLGLKSAGEIARLVAEMHATIASTPGLSLKPWPKDIHHSQAPLPYRIVTGSFDMLAKLVGTVEVGGVELQDPRWRRLNAALNGIAGDKLANWKNRLATSMQLVDLDGHALEFDSQASGHVVFIHGLCHSELDWRSSSHQDYIHQLENKGYQALWLRYNTGLNIFRNGKMLADSLEALHPHNHPLILIGHSMGGLVIRSACAYAQQQQHEWLNDLTHATYIGSPHLGSPLERSGNLVNSLIGITPYARPFTRLGNIRSQGIKDLRHGYILEEDAINGEKHQRDVRSALEPLHTTTQHLLIASRLKNAMKQNWVGDGLVPVNSALGEHSRAGMNLSAPYLHKEFIDELGHVAMLSDARVYNLLSQYIVV